MSTVNNRALSFSKSLFLKLLGGLHPGALPSLLFLGDKKRFGISYRVQPENVYSGSFVIPFRVVYCLRISSSYGEKKLKTRPQTGP